MTKTFRDLLVPRYRNALAPSIYVLLTLKPFFNKARQSIENCLNPKLVSGSILKNGFEGTLR